jgi:hypothetical protein
MTEQCKACGRINPPGGLTLGPEGGGAEYEWFCRDAVACAEEIARQIREASS